MFRLTPEQVTKFWPSLREAVEYVRPLLAEKAVGDYITRLFMECLSGEAVVWLVVDEKRNIEVFLITKVIGDKLSRTRDLLVYIAYSYKTGKIDPRTIEDAKSTLVKYAKDQLCGRIVTYVKNFDISKIFNMELIAYYVGMEV